MQYHPLGNMLVVIAIMSTILTLVYTFLAGTRIFFGPLKSQIDASTIKDPPLTMSFPLLALALIAVALGLYPLSILSLFHTVIDFL